MRIEERDDFIDIIAQAVIDKIEERDRITGLVNLVVHKVLELQKEETQANQAAAKLVDSVSTRSESEQPQEALASAIL